MESFKPPTGPQLAQHLERHAASGPPKWMTRGPIVALVGLVVLGLLLYQTGARPLAYALPWLGLLGMLGWARWRVHHARTLERSVTRLQELAMLRHHREALVDAWSLLPKVKVSPSLHARAVALMGHLLDSVGAYEAALVAYNHLLEQMPEGHPAAPPLRVQRAVASLHCDHLADADNDLRRLRPLADKHPGSMLSAAYTLAQLVQDVRTGHYADAVQSADRQGDMVDRLRPLGTSAGYGHALLAWCRQQHDPADAAISSDWANATMLMPASALIHRFPELSDLKPEPEKQRDEDPDDAAEPVLTEEEA